MSLLFVSTGVFPGESDADYDACVGCRFFPPSTLQGDRSVHPDGSGWDSDNAGWSDSEDSDYEGLTVYQTLWKQDQGLLQHLEHLHI